MTAAAPSADSIRTLFGTSGRRRLTCSRCKEFSTTNQATYSVHLRDCTGTGASPSTSNAATASMLANLTTSGALSMVASNGNDQPLWPSMPADSEQSGNSPTSSNNTSFFVDPLSWQLVYESAKQLKPTSSTANDSTGASLLTLASAAMAADAVAALSKVTSATTAPNNTNTTGNSNLQTTQPPSAPRPMLGEEPTTGERYGFREVFKHMYQAMVNGSPAYCCRLCPYQHAVRSRVTKHIRLQHFSKQALNMFTCELCSFTTQHITELEHHRRRHAVNTKVYKCSECEYSTPMQNNFKRHLRRHTSSDAFVCSFCSFSSPHEATVKRHAFLYHRKAASNQEGAKTGDINGKDVAATTEASNDDEIVGGGEPDGCADDNNSRSSLKQQVAASFRAQQTQEAGPDCDRASDSGASSNGSGSNGGIYVCDVCSSGFQSLGEFSQHRAEHDHAEAAHEVKQQAGANSSTAPLDLTFQKQQPEMLHDTTANTADGILNLSTKPTAGAANRTNPRKSVAVKRNASPSSVSSPLLYGKQAKIEQDVVSQSETPVTANKVAACINEDSVDDRRYGCPICSFEATDKAVVRQHILDTHPATVSKTRSQATGRNTASSSSAMLPIRCLTANSKSKPGPSTAPLLMKCAETTTKSATPVRCSNENQQQSPENSIGSNSVAAYQCNVCHYRTNARNNYEKHVAYHEDLKIFKCMTCGYRCNWKWDMNKHCRAVHNIQNIQQAESGSSTTAHIVVLSLEEARATIADYMQRNSTASVWGVPRMLPMSMTSLPQQMKLFRCSSCTFASRRRKMVERHQRQSHGVSNSCSVLEVTSDGHELSELSNVEGLPTPPASHGTPSTSTSTASHSSPPLLPGLQSGVPSQSNESEAVRSLARVFKCSLCGLRSMWKKSIKSHLSTQHPGASDGKILMLYVSQQRHHIEPKPENVVPASLTSASGSLRAKSTCRRYKCPACFYRANFFHDVKKHIRNMHQIEAEVVILDEEFAKRTLADYMSRHAHGRRGLPVMDLANASQFSSNQAGDMAASATGVGEQNETVVSSIKTEGASQPYCHRSQHVFNCRKCNFHSRRRISYLAHCTRHFATTTALEADLCRQCGFAAPNATAVERHQLLWHTPNASSTPPASCSPELSKKPEHQSVVMNDDEFADTGFRCTVCSQEMPDADAEAMRSHVSSLHVPPALLALGAVQLDLLFVPL